LQGKIPSNLFSHVNRIVQSTLLSVLKYYAYSEQKILTSGVDILYR